MNYCVINGRSWDVIVTAIEESFSILYTENTGRTLAIGAPMTLDPLGTFFSHKVTFKRCKENVEEFDGIQGTDKGDWWSVLDGDIKDGKYHLLIEDMERGGVENPEYHDIYIKSDDVEVEDLR